MDDVRMSKLVFLRPWQMWMLKKQLWRSVLTGGTVSVMRKSCACLMSKACGSLVVGETRSEEMQTTQPSIEACFYCKVQCLCADLYIPVVLGIGDGGICWHSCIKKMNESSHFVASPHCEGILESSAPISRVSMACSCIFNRPYLFFEPVHSLKEFFLHPLLFYCNVRSRGKLYQN